MIRALLKDVNYGMDPEETLEALARPLPQSKARPRDSLEYPALVETLVSHHTYARFPQFVLMRIRQVEEEQQRRPINDLVLKLITVTPLRGSQAGGQGVQLRPLRPRKQLEGWASV
ncbi:hypothetical protein WMY93_031623 [Mugilogobius chulae]|uniref:Uncharacterized protein n=1 Tax=Mugilogobius chulae TaxID=88201 RepID=A0AAW0MFQ0_9GOBI